jgi:ribosomal protein S27AE
MTSRVQIRLKTVTGPWHNGLVSSPPILNASHDTNDFTCGKCGVVLMHAADGQVHNLAILCTRCGSYNSTDP